MDWSDEVRARLEAQADVHAIGSDTQTWVWAADICAALERVEHVEGAMRADDKRLEDAAVKVWGEHRWGCDTPDQMADLILFLRQLILFLRQRVEELEDGWPVVQERPQCEGKGVAVTDWSDEAKANIEAAIDAGDGWPVVQERFLRAALGEIERLKQGIADDTTEWRNQQRAAEAKLDDALAKLSNVNRLLLDREAKLAEAQKRLDQQLRAQREEGK